MFYILQEATELGKKARDLKKAADSLHQEERSGSKGRKWRKNVKAVEKVYFTIDNFGVDVLSPSFPFECGFEYMHCSLSSLKILNNLNFC